MEFPEEAEEDKGNNREVDEQRGNNHMMLEDVADEDTLPPPALMAVALVDNEQEIREQNGGTNSRRCPMSERDQVILRDFFITKQANTWLKADKKRNIDALISDKFFQHLSKKQISRRFDMYMLEFTLREKFGTKFYNATVAMKDGPFVDNNILAILVEWREFFLINPYNGLPDELDAFICRCKAAFNTKLPETNAENLHSYELSDQDKDSVASFVDFSRQVLLVSYANAWAIYANIICRDYLVELVII